MLKEFKKVDENMVFLGLKRKKKDLRLWSLNLS